MSAANATIPRRPSLAGRPWLAALGAAALTVIVVWWTWRAFHDPATDVGLAYQGGQLAWSSGHPEHLASWDGMPFLAAAMALISRVLSGGTTTELMTALNVVLVLVIVAVVLYRLREVLTPRWWWLTALALLSFGPTMSSVWWKQFNVVALGLALGGFEFLRHGRTPRGAALIGLSIAIKPLVFLLPLVMLIRRETRRAGALAIAWVTGLNLAAGALFAWRAHDLGALNPYIALHNFVQKARPENIWACHPENFAPGSLLCRLAGARNWTLQHLVVWAAVALLGAWVVDALRGRRATSWELFAFTLPLSVMLSPLAWSHYQIVLAPLFVLLLVRFSGDGASVGAWAGLVVAFALASLVWQPNGTLIGAVRGVLSTKTQTQHDLFTIEDVAQFAQYVLVLTGVLWYTQARARG